MRRVLLPCHDCLLLCRGANLAQSADIVKGRCLLAAGDGHRAQVGACIGMIRHACVQVSYMMVADRGRLACGRLIMSFIWTG